MKNKIKILLILLTFFLFVGNVNAYSDQTTFSINEWGKSKNGMTYGDNKPYYANIYLAKSNEDSSEQYMSYCIDPGVPAGSKTVSYGVDHILADSKSSTPVFDYGTLTILQNSPTFEEMNREDYEATLLALRMYINGIGLSGMANPSDDFFHSFINTFYLWLKDDKKLKNAYDAYLQYSSPDNILEAYDYSIEDVNNYKFKGINSNVLKKAKKLIIAGLDAAVEKRNGKIVVPTVSATLAGQTKPKQKDDTISRLIVMQLKPNNFGTTKKSVLHYDGFEYDETKVNVEYIGYSKTYSKKEKDFTKDTLHNENLLTKFSGKPIYLAYKVTMLTSDSDSDGCGSTFTVNYSYKDPKLINGAILRAESDIGKDYSSLQRFAIYSTKKVKQSYNINANICEDYCEPEMELPQICEDGTATDSSGYVTYKYREGVNEGSSDIQKCIIGESDASGNSHQLIDSKYAAVVENNPYCAVYCKESFNFHMPNKIDNVSSGRYFQIGLKIDAQQDCYLSELNRDKFIDDIVNLQKQLVENYNGYIINKAYSEAKIELLTSSSSKNSCANVGDQSNRSNNGVDTETWDEVTSVWKITIPAYSIYTYSVGNYGQVSVTKKDVNEQTKYVYYKEGKSGTWTPPSTVPSTPSTTPNLPDIQKPGGNTNKPEQGTVSNEYSINRNIPKIQLIESPVTNPSSPGSSSGSRNSKPKYTKSNGKSLADYSSCEQIDSKITNPASSITDRQSNNTNDVDYFAEAISNSEGRIKDIVYKLNSCIYDWDLVYDFNPEVKYSYNEPEPNNEKAVPKWIELAQSFGGDIMVEKSKKVESTKCADGTESYCTVVDDKIKTIDGEKVDAVRYCSTLKDEKTYECKDTFKNSAAHFNNYNFTYCTTDGCFTTNLPVTQANYVHKVATAKVELDTKRVYYSSNDKGEIRVSETKPNLKNLTIVDGLPVAASTPKGTYFYTISLNKIGNYYATGDVGRVYGYMNQSLSQRLKEVVSTIDSTEIKENEFACTYEVNEPDITYCIKEDDEYYVCNSSTFDDSCVKKKSKNAALKEAKINVNCDSQKPTTYCVMNGDNYYVCDSKTYNSNSCTQAKSMEEAIKSSTFNHNCESQETKYCVMNGDNYYVCKSKTYNSSSCTQAESMEAALKETNGINSNCEMTYCIENKGTYYVCKTNTYSSDSSICKAKATMEEAINSSKENVNCEKIPLTTYCVMNNNKYYVCNSKIYDKVSCGEAKSMDDAIKEADINYNCESPETKYCVMNGDNYYVCKSKTYNSSSCTQAESMEAALKETDGFNSNCDLKITGTKYCVMNNKKYYVCKTKDYSSSTCMQKATMEEAINESSENVNCDPTYCVMNGNNYYVCKTSSYDSSCTQAGSMEEAIKATQVNYNCKKSETKYCVMNNKQYYVCSSQTYDSSCSKADSMDDALANSDSNVNCEKTYCIKKNKKYYVCKTKAYGSSTCMQKATMEEAIKDSIFNISCDPEPSEITYCVKNNDNYYVCPTESFNDKNCSLMTSKEVALNVAMQNSNCETETTGKKYCVKGSKNYYVCSSTKYDKETCKAYKTRDAAIAASDENWNCCPNCTVVCIGTCLIDTDTGSGSGLLIDFRTITPANLNPNNRKLGYNWDTTNKSNLLVANKAQNTISEIQARANVDVDTASDAKIEKVSDYKFKVKMTPQIATWIKTYNSNDGDGKRRSYNNDTLKCYDYTIDNKTIGSEEDCKKAGYAWESDGCKMKNIFCYSEFIDEIITKFPDQIDSKNREDAKTASWKNYQTYQNLTLTLPSKKSKIMTNDYWTVYIYESLDINGDGIPDIGPSWK